MGRFSKIKTLSLRVFPYFSSYGFDQMRQAGAVLTTFESIVLRLVEDASHPKFKQIQSLIRNLVPDTGLVSSTL